MVLLLFLAAGLRRNAAQPHPALALIHDASRKLKAPAYWLGGIVPWLGQRIMKEAGEGRAPGGGQAR
jgi:hypothetical protein